MRACDLARKVNCLTLPGWKPNIARREGARKPLCDILLRAALRERGRAIRAH